MGSSSYHCGDLVVGFCGTGVESIGLEIFQLLSSSSLWLEFFYAIMITILRIHTTGSPGGREGVMRV